MSQTIPKLSISTDLATRIVAAAHAKATEVGVPMTIVVVDESGILKALSRMDGASLISLEAAQRKAYTAVASGAPTDGFYSFISSDPVLDRGVPELPGILAVGGGLPISVQDSAIGALGVAGGHYTQDIEVAQAGVAVVA